MSPCTASVMQECACDRDSIGSLDNLNGIQKEACISLKPITSSLPENEVVNADLRDALCSSPYKNVPVRFLYDDKGSELYEKITQLEEYYPYEEERALLRLHADDILANIPSAGAVLVELGCGDGSKTAVLLDALAARDGPENVRFLGIDVSGGALLQASRNLQVLCPNIPAANLELCEAEYLPGLSEARNRHPNATLCILWLGSSVGNFTPDDTVAFLHAMRCAIGDHSSLLLCTDLWKDPSVLHAAYDDSKGVTREFIINGMCHALRTLGHPQSNQTNIWGYEAVVNAEMQQVEMWVEAKETVRNVLPGLHIQKGERILMEISRKLTPQGISVLAQRCGLCISSTWASSKYSIQLLVPIAEALRRCWRDTDALFSHILDWTAQPIGLRHPFAFYYGHVAAFAKLKILSAGTDSTMQPTSMDIMFSRGIDPNVLDPSKCHDHPLIPTAWPSKSELEGYVSAVRARLLAAVGIMPRCSPTAPRNNNADDQKFPPDMHAVVMCLEHERMHQETLCYMIAQQRKLDWIAGTPGAVIAMGEITPPGPRGMEDAPELNSYYFAQSSYLVSVNAALESVLTLEKRFCSIPGGSVCLGLGMSYPSGFVWDNERGSRGPIQVAPFAVSCHPVTVAEFRRFLEEFRGYDDPSLWSAEDFAHMQSTKQSMPATWSTTSGASGDGIAVHVPEGTLSFAEAANCPVYVSLAEARAYAAHEGGRIMTEAEYQRVVDLQRQGRVGSNAEGEYVADIDSAGWEWTSSAFEPFEGFKSDPLYPEYSTDFFDGCHFVLKGASPYTHPSLRRESFRNYYQHLYPYVFAKFRVIKDAKRE